MWGHHLNTIMFRQKEFEIIDNFLSKEEIEYHSSSLQNVERAKFQHDMHVPDAYSIYNYIPHVELLCNKLHLVAGCIDAPLLPGYAYARKYQNNNDLYKHTDRESCEIAVSLHLYGDMEWPIFFEKVDGTVLELILKPGQALVYEGHVNQHWREPYKGIEYGQVFLFYIKSRGKFANHYFDLDVQSMRAISEMQRNKLLAASKKFK